MSSISEPAVVFSVNHSLSFQISFPFVLDLTLPIPFIVYRTGIVGMIFVLRLIAINGVPAFRIMRLY